MNAIRLNPKDNVAVSMRDIKRGEKIQLDDGETVTAAEDIGFAHKIALENIPEGGKVIKYGHIIGEAIKYIKIGNLVHIHNIVSTKHRVK